MITLEYDAERARTIHDLLSRSSVTLANAEVRELVPGIPAADVTKVMSGTSVKYERRLGRWSRRYPDGAEASLRMRLREPTALRRLKIMGGDKELGTIDLTHAAPKTIERREYYGHIAWVSTPAMKNTVGMNLYPPRLTLFTTLVFVLLLLHWLVLDGLPLELRLVFTAAGALFCFWGVHAAWLPWHSLPVSLLGGFRLWPLLIVLTAPVGMLLCRARDLITPTPHGSVMWLAFGLGAAAMVLFVVLVRHGVFHDTTFDNDETGYLYQARVFADGRFYDEENQWYKSFRPSQTIVAQGRVIGKYWPAPSLHFALGFLVGWPMFPVLLLGILSTLTTVRCAQRLWGSPPAVAFALLALLTSTSFLMIHTVALSQVPMLLYEAITLWALATFLTTARRPLSRGLVAGFALGVVGLCRPLDMLIIGGGVAVACLLVIRRISFRRLLSFAGSGAVVCAALTFGGMLYNFYLSGTWTPAFLQFNPLDHLGFGDNLVRPHSPMLGIEQLADNIRTASLLASFVPPLVALLAVFLASRRQRAPAIGLATILLLYPAAYTAMFWRGGYGAGPLYQVGMVIPAAILGGRALSGVDAWIGTRLRNFAARRAFRVYFLVTPLIAAAMLGTVTLIDQDANKAKAIGAPRHLARDADVSEGIIFIRSLDDKVAAAAISNDYHFPPDNRGIICALNRGPQHNLTLMRNWAPNSRAYFFTHDKPTDTERLEEWDWQKKR
ncbi:MAG: hypothetical protein HY706_19335 [Candidatus Hydrogenedentes bacterium]|nr:hypothetical protein [Candidatus Hydrogenedentota bacterium]